jgi:hypothetical protein
MKSQGLSLFSFSRKTMELPQIGRNCRLDGCNSLGKRSKRRRSFEICELSFVIERKTFYPLLVLFVSKLFGESKHLTRFILN